MWLRQKTTVPPGIWLWHLFWNTKTVEQWKIGFDIYFIFIQGYLKILVICTHFDNLWFDHIIRSTFWVDMFTKKSYVLSDLTQKAKLINETESALPKTGFQTDTLMSFCGWLALFQSLPDWLRVKSSSHQHENPPKFRNGYSYDFELSNGRNYLDAERDQWTNKLFYVRRWLQSIYL